MNRVVFLLEEFSMKVLLDAMLPRVAPGLHFLCVAHEGRRDLEKSIPVKLKNWREPGVRFIIVRDNDGGDCSALKQRLRALSAVLQPDAIMRIACQELEAWYLGDPEALAAAFGDQSLAGIADRARSRDPDAVAEPAQALTRLVPAFQKVAGARAMAATLAPEPTRSRSFRSFMEAVKRLAPDPATSGRRAPQP
jgi:hypothetical protein